MHYRLLSFAGLCMFVFSAWLVSEDRKRISWRLVAWGLSLQAVFAINALGDLRDIDALRSDLAAVFARRPAVAPNVVEAAVNVVWLIGNSEQVGALDAAVALLAEYIEAGDAAFSQLVTDKVLFLSRRSIGSAASVAGALAARQRWRSAERILGHEDVVKMRQVALIDGGEEALGDLWAVERVLLAALEAREQFEACQAQIVRLTQSKRVETFERIAGPTALSSFAARIEAKKAFVALLNGDRKPEDVVAGLVGLAERFPVAAPWAVGRIKTSTSAALLIEAVLKAPEVPEDLKKDLRPEAE